MKILGAIGSILVAFAFMISTSQATVVQSMDHEGNSKGVISQSEKNGSVTILNTDPYMGLYDYELGVPSQRDKASIPDELIATGQKDSTYMGLGAYEQGVPSQRETGIDEEQAVYYAGALTSVNPDGTLMVRLSVPGISGPTSMDVPFNITKDTTMTICYKSVASCDSSGNALKELNTLAELENLSDFNEAKKDVVIVNNIETGEVVHVEIEYNL